MGGGGGGVGRVCRHYCTFRRSPYRHSGPLCLCKRCHQKRDRLPPTVCDRLLFAAHGPPVVGVQILFFSLKMFWTAVFIFAALLCCAQSQPSPVSAKCIGCAAGQLCVNGTCTFCLSDAQCQAEIQLHIGLPRE